MNLFLTSLMSLRCGQVKAVAPNMSKGTVDFLTKVLFQKLFTTGCCKVLSAYCAFPGRVSKLRHPVSKSG